MADRPDSQPRPMPAGHVIVVVLVALLGGAVLNSQALADAAARQPFGWQRTIAVAAVTPFRGIATLLSLDQPHTVLAEAAADATGVPRVSATEPPAEGTAAGNGQPPAGTPPTSAPTPTPTQPPTESADEQRRATVRNPLRLWVGGDSLTSEFGPALSDRLARTRRGDAHVEFRFSTGLARPDFFDWPARLAAVAEEFDPEVYVVMFGANDGQNVEVDGTVLGFDTDEWAKEYADRVGSLMDQLTAEGSTVYWIGQPVMRAADFDAKMQILNEVYEAQAEQREAVTYIPTRELFAGPDGEYVAYLEDSNGARVLMRQQDGIHLTRAGGERLTTVLFEPLDEQWRLTRGN